MMKALAAVTLFVASVPAAAQTGASGTIMNPGFANAWQSTVDLRRGQGSDETPTMRALKLERARALHEEAATLLEQDGGALTPEHEAYIRRKACDILETSQRHCRARS